MIDDDLLNSISEMRLRFADPDDALLDYARRHDLDIHAVIRKAGPVVVTTIKDHGAGRFDFDDGIDGKRGLVCVANGSDGETPVDLVGWHFDNPARVMTLCGRCGFLGLDQAYNPLTFLFDTPLTIHRTPLEWMQAGCKGAVIVTPQVAAWQMLDVPGRMAARDHEHGRELVRIAQSLVDVSRVVVPTKARRDAA